MFESAGYSTDRYMTRTPNPTTRVPRIHDGNKIKSTTPCRGFALIVSIALMAFVFLLLISLNALVVVQTQLSTTQTSNLEARQNALQGLNIALGELQRLVGPDQRVTARADILESYDKATNASGGQPVANPYYTAVWDVRPTTATAWPHQPGATNGPDMKQSPAFLVSGNEGFAWGDDATFDESSTTFEDPYTFETVGVTVEKQALSDPSGLENNSYAWWIGDEGVKARLNREDWQATTGTSIPEWTRPTGATPQLLSSELRDMDRDLYASTAEKAKQLEDLELVDGAFEDLLTPASGTQEQPYFHDFTLHASGVLADIRNGGLKKDLTLALAASSANAPAGTQDSDSLLPEFSYDANYQVFSPTWGYLRDHIDGVSRVPSSSAIIPDDASWASDEIVTMRKPDGVKPGILPVITRAQVGLTPVLVQTNPGANVTGATPEWEVYYYYSPTIVLWNPYDVAMEIPELKLIARPYTGSGGLTFTEQYNTLLQIEDDTGIIATNETPGDNEGIGKMHFALPTTVIPAGRAVIFSAPDGEVALSDSASGNPLQPGWRPVAAYFRPTGVTFPWDIDDDPAGPDIAMEIFLPRGLNSHNSAIWDLIETNQTSGWLTDESAYVCQLIDCFFYNQIKGIKYGAGQLRRIGDTGDISETLLYPAILQVVAMKFADVNAGLTSAYGSEKVRWAYDFNPRTEFSSGNPTNNLPGAYSQGLFFGTPVNFDIPLASDDPNAEPTFSLFGSLGGDFKSDRLVLYHVPEVNEPHFNLASLRHANLASSTIRPMGGLYPRGGQQFAPAFTLGESMVSGLIPPEDIVVDANAAYTVGAQVPRFYLPDIAYLVNETVYDQFFFSALDGSGASQHPLLIESGVVAPTNAVATGFDQNAAAWTLDGAFNVNSTSVEAWTAFLASQLDASVELHDGSSDSISGVPFPRMEEPQTGSLGQSQLNLGDPDMLRGFRRLDDAQVRALATAMAEEVKVRGPFSSMSQFVNRLREDPDASWTASTRPVRSDIPGSRKQEVVSKGALQAALDRATVTTNGQSLDLPNEALVTESIAATNLASTYTNLANPDALDGVVTQGMPGYLMQGDILASLDSAMTVRSDTFRIMAYGEVRDPLTDKMISSARCEAIVQRLPEFIDANADAAWAAPYTATGGNNLNSVLNQDFGRRFAVVAFRWLD